jgi:predicted permease
VSYFAIPMPILIDSTLAALGQVGVPCCLVLLGASVFHARNRFQARGVGLIILFKLALMPAVVFLLAQFVFELEPLAVAVLTTMGALPTGANPYLLTQRYNQGVSMAATAVAATTALSVISLPYVLSQFAHVR